MEVDIAIKVGTAVLIFLFGRLSPWVWSWVHYRSAKRFWRPVVRSQPTVVVGRHELAEFEPSGLIGVGDEKAVDLFREHFHTLHLSSNFQVRYVDELPSGNSYDGTFVCLGGPDASPNGQGVIADLWRAAPTSFTWGDPAEHDITIYDRESSEQFRPHDFPGKVTRDYALIVRMPNPFSQSGAEEHALLFAGCLGFGTWGAARFATTAAFLKDRRVENTDAFECLLSIDVANRSPVRTELVAFRELSLNTSPSLSRESDNSFISPGSSGEAAVGDGATGGGRRAD